MPQSVTIYHNPRCSKSRETLTLLEKNGITPTVIYYLETPPSPEMLRVLLTALGFHDARQLMRTTEKIYTELNLTDCHLTQMQLLQAMSDNPALIERPIVVAGKRARLGRPPEAVKSLF